MTKMMEEIEVRLAKKVYEQIIERIQERKDYNKTQLRSLLDRNQESEDNLVRIAEIITFMIDKAKETETELETDQESWGAELQNAKYNNSIVGDQIFALENLIRKREKVIIELWNIIRSLHSSTNSLQAIMIAMQDNTMQQKEVTDSILEGEEQWEEEEDAD